MTFHVVRQHYRLCVKFSHPDIFSVAPAAILDSNIFLNSSMIIFVDFTFTLSASQVYVITKLKLVRQHQHSSTISSTWEPYSASFLHPRVQLEQSLFPMSKKKFTIRFFFTYRLQKNFFELCFPGEACEWVTAQISSNRYHWMFNVSP